MPIEIREMLIRAFVGSKDEKDPRKDKKDEKKKVQASTAKSTLAAIRETINREKER